MVSVSNRTIFACNVQIAESAVGIEAVLQGITALDVVAARAKHAAWCSAARPSFSDEEEAERDGPVRVPSMRHPVLLQVSCRLRI